MTRTYQHDASHERNHHQLRRAQTKDTVERLACKEGGREGGMEG